MLLVMLDYFLVVVRSIWTISSMKH